MGILGFIVLGLIIGVIAKAIMPGNDPGGILITMAIGVLGALLGGVIGSAIFGGGLGTFFDLRTWLLALLGSVILLAGYRMVTGRQLTR